jgi:hypothetical protein
MSTLPNDDAATTKTRVASYISPKARKGDRSGIQGRGLFAIQPISEGDVVAVKGGHIVDSTTLAGLSEQLQNSEIQIAEELATVRQWPALGQGACTPFRGWHPYAE